MIFFNLLCSDSASSVSGSSEGFSQQEITEAIIIKSELKNSGMYFA